MTDQTGCLYFIIFYRFYFTLLGSSSWHLCFEYYLWPKVLIFQYEMQEGNWQNQSVMSHYTLFLNPFLSISSNCGYVNIIHGFNTRPDRHTKFKWPMSTLKQDFRAQELNGVLQSLLLFFRGLAVSAEFGSPSWLALQFEQLTCLLCVCMGLVSAGAHTEGLTFPLPCSSGSIQGCRTWGNLSGCLHT